MTYEQCLQIFQVIAPCAALLTVWFCDHFRLDFRQTVKAEISTTVIILTLALLPMLKEVIG